MFDKSFSFKQKMFYGAGSGMTKIKANFLVIFSTGASVMNSSAISKISKRTAQQEGPGSLC